MQGSLESSHLTTQQRLRRCLDAEREATASAAYDVENLVQKTLLGLKLLRETQRSNMFDPKKTKYCLQELN